MHLDFIQIYSCFQLIVSLTLQSSVSVWKFDTFRQTHRTTEAHFTCPLGHQTSILTCPQSKLTCPGQWHLGFSCPVTRTVSTLTVFFLLSYRTVPYPVNQKVTKTPITCLVKLPPKFIIPDPALLV